MATINDGFYVGNATTKPLTALNARLAMGAHWATDSAASFDIRTGVVFAGVQSLLTATAETAPMSVTVAPLHFVGSKGDSNGMYLPSSPTTVSALFSAAPALGQKRIDVVYAVQQDSDATVSPDGTISAVIAVRTGTTHPTAPVKPDVATLVPGAVELGTVTFDSTSIVATATNQAQVTVATTCQWTAPRGCPIPVRSATERDALGAFEGLRVARLDLGGSVESYDGTRWRGALLTYTPVWAADTTQPNKGNGTITGSYRVDDNGEVDCTILLTLGSTGTSQGSGNYKLSLPVPADDTKDIQGRATYAISGSSANTHVMVPTFSDASNIRLLTTGNPSAIWDFDSPGAITINTALRVRIRYTAA